jgi:peptide chain release factor 1
MELLKRLDEIRQEYKELEGKLSEGADIDYQRYGELREIMKLYEELKGLEEEIKTGEEMLGEEDDEEMRGFIREEVSSAKRKQEELLEEIKGLLIPRDPTDERSAIVEVRQGAGGEESALFAADLFRMYQRYCEERGWKVEVLDSHPTSIGGFKQITFAVLGKGAYGSFKFESGVHRVQRVPLTESSGRIHTSTATVAVLPEAEDVEVEIDPEDLKIETFRSSGPGGQHANVTDSAVRITHIPTGIVVSCQDEKSQHKNKAKALRVLRARLKEKLEEEQEREKQKQRRIQIGSAARSEKIRTYNFPQNRVTDHRINLTLYQLEEVLEGNLEPIIRELSKTYREDLLDR